MAFLIPKMRMPKRQRLGVGGRKVASCGDFCRQDVGSTFFRVWLVLLFLFAGFAVQNARAQVSREYKLKAVFLFHFAEFVDWPTNAFASTNSPLVIGILGNDPFGAALDETVKGESVKGHKLVVERYRRVEEIKTCHILFVAQSESPNLRRIMRNLKGRPILTVSDSDRATEDGVIIRFSTQNNKIRLKINLDASNAAGLTISSKLLRAADVVGTVKGKS
jgi:hypothetical protein